MLRPGLDPEDGRIAALCNLEEERKANLKFLELEVTQGNGFLESVAGWVRMRQLWRRTRPHCAARQYRSAPDLSHCRGA